MDGHRCSWAPLMDALRDPERGPCDAPSHGLMFFVTFFSHSSVTSSSQTTLMISPEYVHDFERGRFAVVAGGGEDDLVQLLQKLVFDETLLFSGNLTVRVSLIYNSNLEVSQGGIREGFGFPPWMCSGKGAFQQRQPVPCPCSRRTFWRPPQESPLLEVVFRHDRSSMSTFIMSSGLGWTFLYIPSHRHGLS